jgi:hypothetical protein
MYERYYIVASSCNRCCHSNERVHYLPIVVDVYMYSCQQYTERINHRRILQNHIFTNTETEIHDQVRDIQQVLIRSFYCAY